MSDQKKNDVGHLSGLSPSDSGQSSEDLSGSVKAFRRSPTEEPIAHSDREGPSSSPDDPGNEGFVVVDDHPVYDTIREHSPEIVHEDAERLERQRVDQDDEIIAQYDPATDTEKAVLRPRETKKGAKSEGL